MIGALVYGVVKGGAEVLLIAPVLVGNVVLYALTLGHLGSFEMTGEAQFVVGLLVTRLMVVQFLIGSLVQTYQVYWFSCWSVQWCRQWSREQPSTSRTAHARCSRQTGLGQSLFAASPKVWMPAIVGIA